jgi:NhaP-type Na+/H+ or K+/H+ antiporter
MLPVAISLVGTGLAPSTVAFMGWFGPRGLASVVLAILALHGTSDTGGLASTIGSAVALTIALSVVAHGLTAGPAVRAYARVVAGLPGDAPELGRVADLRTRGRALATGHGGVRPTPAIDDPPSACAS